MSHSKSTESGLVPSESEHEAPTGQGGDQGGIRKSRRTSSLPLFLVTNLNLGLRLPFLRLSISVPEERKLDSAGLCPEIGWLSHHECVLCACPEDNSLMVP